jgi:hypothetical protein
MAENREPSGIAKNPIDLLAEKLGMTRDRNDAGRLTRDDG